MENNLDSNMLTFMRTAELTFSRANDRILTRDIKGATGKALGFLTRRTEDTMRTVAMLARCGQHRWEIDAATLLRASFEAYLQAEYIVSNFEDAEQRAQNYLDFMYIERRNALKLLQDISSRTAKSIVGMSSAGCVEELERNYNTNKPKFSRNDKKLSQNRRNGR